MDSSLISFIFGSLLDPDIIIIDFLMQQNIK